MIAKQCELFEEIKFTWLDVLISTALSMPCPFWFSELRREMPFEPLHKNMWGSATKRLKKAGFRQTGKYRASKTGSRKGSMEFQWTR